MKTLSQQSTAKAFISMNSVSWVTAVLGALVLSGCGGSSENTQNASSQQTVVTSNSRPATVFVPASVTNDPTINNDKTNFTTALYMNIYGTDRCGQCHTTPHDNITNPQASNRPFADKSVDTAYTAALQFVNQSNPAASAMVTKVAGGHNCWKGNSPAAVASCASDLSTWITNWFNPPNTTTDPNAVPLGTTISLEPVGVSQNVTLDRAIPKTVPSSYGDLHNLLTQHCSSCHVPGIQLPFAVADMQSSYDTVINNGKVNVGTPNASQLYLRLAVDHHNCFDPTNTGKPGDCAASGSLMLTAINTFVGGLPPADNSALAQLVTSRAVSLVNNGIVSSGNGRYETGQIALYEFKHTPGTPNVIEDTSNVSDTTGTSHTDLNLSGGTEGVDYAWLGNYGLRFLTNKTTAVASQSASTKLYNLISQSGEYSLEAWVMPANITQQNANIVSYALSTQSRNMGLYQNMYSYRSYNRSSVSAANSTDGTPMFEVGNANNQIAKTELQHVVIVFSPSTGRSIFVNGSKISGDGTPATLANWSDQFLLRFGTQTTTNPWLGTMRMVAIHNHALTAAQVKQNFDAGVGQKFYLMFDVTTDGQGNPTGLPEGSYVYFEVVQYDDRSYLFVKPKFVNVLGTALNIKVAGMHIGLNGVESVVGQAFANIDETVDTSNTNAYIPGEGQLLSPLGAIIPIVKGSSNPNPGAHDDFFISFKVLGSLTASKDYNPTTAVTAADYIPQSKNTTAVDVATRGFEEIDASLSMFTDINRNDTSPISIYSSNSFTSDVQDTFLRVYQQLPPTEAVGGFVSSHQSAVTELAINYCSRMVATVAAAGTSNTYFNNVDVTTYTPASLVSTASNRQAIINPMLARLLYTGSGVLTTMPDYQQTYNDLDQLIIDLANTNASSNSGCTGTCRTKQIITATCAAAMSSAPMLLQ